METWCFIFIGLSDLFGCSGACDWMIEFLKLETFENIMMLTLFTSVLDLLFKAQCRVWPMRNFRGERRSNARQIPPLQLRAHLYL